ARGQSSDLAAQLVGLVGTGAEVTELEPDLADLARRVVTQLSDLALETADEFGECVHAIAEFPDFGAQLRDLTAQLEVLRLLELEEVVRASEASVHASKARLHRVGQCRDRG